MHLRTVSLLTSLTMFFSLYTAVVASGSHELRIAPQSPSTQKFRLDVEGHLPSGTTFWVAYGPLAGHFGVIRLHPVGSNVYAASAKLPGAGRTFISYLRGSGAVKTRAGWAPGDPVVTIKTIGPIVVPRLELPTVQWQAPVG